MTDSESDRLRNELRALGSRRERLEADQDTLAAEVRETLGRSYGKVPVAEAARLLHIHRTTVYRVYEPHERAA